MKTEDQLLKYKCPTCGFTDTEWHTFCPKCGWNPDKPHYH